MHKATKSETFLCSTFGGGRRAHVRKNIVPCVGYGTREKKRKVKVDCTGVVVFSTWAAGFGNWHQHASVGGPEEGEALVGCGISLPQLAWHRPWSPPPIVQYIHDVRRIAFTNEVVNKLRRRAHNQSFPSIVRPNRVPNPVAIC